MAFLDNSGDIILDAVLTDEGRRRLAQGDGTFNITKFSFGDDEIDYTLYNPNHPSGSAYFDLEILQTPIFEAFTNNGSLLKSKIITVNDLNLLYLPVIKLNDQQVGSSRVYTGAGQGTFLCLVDQRTAGVFDASDNGIISSPADRPISDTEGSFIRLDQGLDTTSVSPTVGLATDLREDTFILEMDNRLGRIIATDNTEKNYSNLDDDDIATYVFSSTTDPLFVEQNTSTSTSAVEVIAGPRGNYLKFKIRPQVDLAESDYYFDLFGTSETSPTYAGNSGDTIATSKFVDSVITIYGASTGYTVQVPVRYLKVKTTS